MQIKKSHLILTAFLAVSTLGLFARPRHLILSEIGQTDRPVTRSSMECESVSGIIDSELRELTLDFNDDLGMITIVIVDTNQQVIEELVVDTSFEYSTSIALPDTNSSYYVEIQGAYYSSYAFVPN